jgi:PIN domain nuclease of toxin-antitoxin system
VIVIDTHVLVWVAEGNPRVGEAARETIARASRETGIHVSAITPWEIAMLAQKGRLALGQEVGLWIDAALALDGVRLAPITPAIAVDSVRLPGTLHSDPADRLIIATARRLGFPLLTADRAVLTYGAAGHVAVADASV